MGRCGFGGEENDTGGGEGKTPETLLLEHFELGQLRDLFAERGCGKVRLALSTGISLPTYWCLGFTCDAAPAAHGYPTCVC